MARPAGAMSRTRAAVTRRITSRSGRATAEQVSLALDYLRKQDFVRSDAAVVLGHSAGAWGALALANADPKAISAILAFAPGRGGHANDEANRICAPHTLLAAAAEFGRAARVPVTWLVADNDSYFAPAFSRIWRTRFVAAVERSISARCPRWAARAIG